MVEDKNLDEKIAGAFRESTSLPEDRYFKKIWDSIACKAPVGKRYYLRSFFSMFFILVFLAVFIYFYSDFLSSVLTLKEMGRENRETSASLSPLKPLEASMRFDIPGGIHITAKTDSRVLLQNQHSNPREVVVEFFSGHMLAENSPPSPTKGISPGAAATRKVLTVVLPDCRVFITAGLCNLFCYDGIIRVSPLGFPVEIEHEDKRETVNPGSTFYLLDNKKTIIIPDVEN
ncbi:MAG: hypothetical protein GY765_21050 [bacterium]|nr:hypothetical protein [bacterium]